MKNFTIKEIADITGGELFSERPEATLKRFSIDSRNIEPGDFFIAIKGENYDGHDFIEDAVNKGVAGVIVQEPFENNTVAVILVKDTLKAMGAIAKEIRSASDIPVICITGTNGKTTVKDMLSHILSARYSVLKSKKSYNNMLGLSLTLFALEDFHEIAIFELGTNHPGEIAKLADIARPDAVVITNIGDGHLEFLKDREGVFKEKISIIDSLVEEGAVFLNKDDDILAGIEIKDKLIKFFGTHDGSDFIIDKIDKKENITEFFVNANKFSITLSGVHNIYNLTVAIAVSEHFGVTYDQIKGKIKNIPVPKMRLEEVTVGDFLFINDAYNANPSSFKCALEVLADKDFAGKKGVIAGDMSELGEKSKNMHIEIGETIADKKMDFLITLGDNAEYIKQGALNKGMDEKDIFITKTHKDAADKLLELKDGHSIVLLKGSRKSRMEEVLKCFTTFFIN